MLERDVDAMKVLISAKASLGVSSESDKIALTVALSHDPTHPQFLVFIIIPPISSGSFLDIFFLFSCTTIK